MPGEYSQMALEAHFKQINDRLRTIEEQLRKVSDSAGVPYEDPIAEVPEEVIQLAEQGKTLEAAKAYREATGADVKRAMEIVSGL